VVVDHADEAGVAALVGALRLPVGVRGRDEEHVARLDELAEPRHVVAGDAGEAVGEPARVEGVLQGAVRVSVVHGGASLPRGWHRADLRGRPV
jgi:hypothetical protein